MSFGSVNTQHEFITLDKIVGFLPSGQGFTYVLPAKVLRLNLCEDTSGSLAVHATIGALCCISISASRATGVG
jgi:hypothetical protein